MPYLSISMPIAETSGTVHYSIDLRTGYDDAMCKQFIIKGLTFLAIKGRSDKFGKKEVSSLFKGRMSLLCACCFQSAAASARKSSSFSSATGKCCRTRPPPHQSKMTSAMTGYRTWAEREVQDIFETSNLSGKDLSSPCLALITVSRAPGFLSLAWIWTLILGYVQICEALSGCFLKLL